MNALIGGFWERGSKHLAIMSDGISDLAWMELRGLGELIFALENAG